MAASLRFVGENIENGRGKERSVKNKKCGKRKYVRVCVVVRKKILDCELMGVRHVSNKERFERVLIMTFVDCQFV